MSIYNVIIVGLQDDTKIEEVLKILSVLFKNDPEKLRPLLVSKYLIAKKYVDINTAEKYKLALTKAGCVVEIISAEDKVTSEEVVGDVKSKGRTSVGDYSKNHKHDLFKSKPFIILSLIVAGGFFSIIALQSFENSIFSEILQPGDLPQINSAIPKSTELNEFTYESKITKLHGYCKVLDQRKSLSGSGSDYIVEVNAPGIESVSFEVQAQSFEQAFDKIVKYDDFLIIRSSPTIENIFLVKNGQVFELANVGIEVSSESPVGSSYKNGLFGPHSCSFALSGFKGLKDNLVKISASEYISIERKSNSADYSATYVSDQPANQSKYDSAIKTFQEGLSRLKPGLIDFNVDNSYSWDNLIIPAAQIILIEKVIGKDNKSSFLYDELRKHYGDEIVVFLKQMENACPSRQPNIKKISTPSIGSKSQYFSKITLPSYRSDILGLWTGIDPNSLGRTFTFYDDGKVHSVVDAGQNELQTHFEGQYLVSNDGKLTMNIALFATKNGMTLRLADYEDLTGKLLTNGTLKINITYDNNGVMSTWAWHGKKDNKIKQDDITNENISASQNDTVKNYHQDVIKNNNDNAMPSNDLSSTEDTINQKAVDSKLSTNIAININIKKMIDSAIQANENSILENQSIVSALPKPPRGDKKNARKSNDEALVLLKHNQFEKAAELFDRAHKLDPSDIEITDNYAYTLLKSNKLKEAKNVSEDAITLNPGRATAWTTLGQVLALQGNINEATASFTIAYRFSKNRFKTHQFFKDANKDEPSVYLKQARGAAISWAEKAYQELNTTNDVSNVAPNSQ